MTLKPLWAGVALALTTPAAARATASSPNGFVSAHVVTLPGVSPDLAFRSFVALPQWWDPAHSYSGKSSALALEARAGGCWCEQLDGGGSVEHMRVQLVQPGKRLVMSGGLGPLLYQAVAATMDVTFAQAESATTVTMEYHVAGFPSGGADKLAGPVDAVLTAAARRFEAYARSSVTKAKGSEPSPAG